MKEEDYDIYEDEELNRIASEILRLPQKQQQAMYKDFLNGIKRDEYEEDFFDMCVWYRDNHKRY